ncbi:MAG: helix-turn-helix transcriptional regulator [Candidatus Izemoplasmatales bacterium]
MNTVKLLNYMENLRYDRKMTQELYLQDIISQRQYYRYRNGESEVPFDVIIKFANKLQIPLLKLISSYQSSSEKEKKLVQEFLNLVINQRFDEAKQIKKKMKNLLLLDEDTHIFYYLSILLYDYCTKQISSNEMIVELKRNINFDSIMKKEILHDSEIYILGVIMEYSENDRLAIYKKIDNLWTHDKLLLGTNDSLYSQVFFWIIKNLGRLKRYSELIKMADNAIEYAKIKRSYYSVEYFHYYKALAYLELENNAKFEEELYETILILLYMDSYKRNHFFEMIKKDTNIECKEFLIDRLKKEL